MENLFVVEKLGKLSITSGENLGTTFLLEKDITSIGTTNECDIVLSKRTQVDHKACIFKKNGIFVIQQQGGSTIAVNGHTVIEKILESGDTVSVGNTELSFASYQTSGLVAIIQQLAGIKKTYRIAALVLLGIGALMLVLELEISVREHINVWKQSAGAKQEQKAIKQEEVVLTEVEKVTAIATARKRSKIAQSLYEEAVYDKSNVYKAIFEWKHALLEVSQLTPQPVIAQEIQKRITDAQELLQRTIQYYKNNAFIAHQRNCVDEALYLLEQIMCIMPDPTNTDYVWAKQKQQELLSLEGGKHGNKK